MRTNKNGVNKDQKDKVKKDGYNRGQHCVYCLTYPHHKEEYLPCIPLKFLLPHGYYLL